MISSNYNIRLAAVFLLVVVATTQVFAGNPDRAGSSGAIQLLINPWAKSSGLANSGTASITGAEAIFQNVAGLAFTRKTEVMFNSTNYLVGSGININAIGFSQKIGESSVVGLSLSTMGFGDIEITSNDLPDGGLGTFKINYSNIGVSYAKTFSNSIYGGITLRLISERLANVGASGVAFDAGIRYVTGKRENMRFGIAIKNLGPPMSFKGDALTIQVEQNGEQSTVMQRADKFELPSQLNIGFAYDFLFTESFKLTANGNFTSNAFNKDQFMFGAEFNIQDRFIARGGYMVENKGNSSYYDGITNAWKGVAGGFSVLLPINKDGGKFSLDYSFRPTNPFGGIHTIGGRLNL